MPQFEPGAVVSTSAVARAAHTKTNARPQIAFTVLLNFITQIQGTGIYRVVSQLCNAGQLRVRECREFAPKYGEKSLDANIAPIKVRCLCGGPSTAVVALSTSRKSKLRRFGGSSSDIESGIEAPLTIKDQYSMLQMRGWPLRLTPIEVRRALGVRDDQSGATSNFRAAFMAQFTAS